MSNIDLDNLDITKQPLQTFDMLLRESHNPDLLEAEKRHIKKLIIRCVMVEGGHTDTAQICDEKEVEDRAKDFLDKFHIMQNREQVVVCYMRLLSEDSMGWSRNPPWRPKIIDAIDSLLSSTLYKEWKINLTLQHHEKVALLADVVKEQEKGFQVAVDALTSFETFTLQRQKLMLCLNNKTGQFLFRPFLPTNFVSLLTEIYKSVQEYLDQKDTIGIIDAYNDAGEKVNEIIKILNSFHTQYSYLLAEGLCRRLLNLVDENFSSNKAAQPASVVLETPVKKYPLHRLGGNINIGILVKNLGQGYSYDTELEIVGDDSVEFSTTKVTIGRLPPNESQIVSIPGKVIKASERIGLLAQLNWKNYDKEQKKTDTDIYVESQRSDIDWDALARTDPYSLEAIKNENQLVGRKDELNKLLGTITAPKVGSHYIHGQKRVGKTSIALVLQSQLNDLGYLTVYIETGDFVMPSATATINRLGNLLCKKIVEKEPQALRIPLPVFDDALSPITDFFDELTKIEPSKRIVIILDEFDRIPYDLYARGPWEIPFS